MEREKKRRILFLILFYIFLMFVFVLFLGGNIKYNPTIRYSVKSLFAGLDYEKLVLHNNYDAQIDSPFLTKEDLNKMDLSNVDNLMIVAHPDDETLWSAMELIKEDYLVLCITNGKETGNIRYNELTDVMKKTNDKYIVLSYPDAYKFRRVDWKKVGVMDYITKDIETVLLYKNWNKVVTHNPEGEYGHIHHIYVNNITTGLYNKYINKDTLFYFTKYYDKGELFRVDNYLSPLTQQQVEEKMDLLDLYKSQPGAFVKYGQMIKYEKIVNAKDFESSI